MVEKLFLETTKRYSLFKKKDKVILGVSGGPDSVALLYAFLALKDKYRLKIICAHLNHGLRKESDSEQYFVEDLCRRLNVELISEKRDVNKFFKGDSLEQTARNLRFDFFLKCSRQSRIKKVALAHHQDDLAETVIMRIIRGTGLRGLRGILPKSSFKNLTIIRPLIGLRKQEILTWLKEKNISFCIDQSNQDIKFLRNRIRANILPQLEAINPAITSRVADLALNVGFDYDFVYNFSFEQFHKLKGQTTDSFISLNLAGLKQLHPSIFNNVIRIAIEEVKGDTRRIQQSHLNQIDELVRGPNNLASLHLPDILIRKEKASVLIQSLIL